MTGQKNFTGAPVTHQGKTYRWTLTSTSRAGRFMVEQGNLAVKSTSIPLSHYKKFTANKTRVQDFMPHLVTVVLNNDQHFYFDVLSSVSRIPDEEWARALSELSFGYEVVVFVTNYEANLRHTVDERLRLARVLASRQEGIMGSSFFPHKVTGHTASRYTLTDWLDLIDFIVNGELKETFSAFQARNSGRDFKLKPATATRRSSYGYSYGSYNVTNERSDSLFLAHSTIGVIVPRFYQLSKRSRKLEDKLYSMPLEKLVQALYLPLPGTLLVGDTIELLDCLKHVRRVSTTNSGLTYNSMRLTDLGPTWMRKITRAGHDVAMAKFLGGRPSYSYYVSDEAPSIITDLPWDVKISVFVLYSLKKLGLEKTMETLRKLEEETDGVCMRAFMELVRQGGFPEDLPAAWTAVLLPKN